MSPPVLSSLLSFFNRLCTRFCIGMRAKLIILFVFIKVIPLVLLAMLAWHQAGMLGDELRERTGQIVSTATQALKKTADISVADAVDALNKRATDDIERMTTDTARQVANFLYDRDGDILLAASLPQDASVYASFIEQQRGQIILPGEWKLADDGESWIEVGPEAPAGRISSSIPDNDRSFNYRRPDKFAFEYRPLFLEMTFIDLQGRERIKVVSSPRMDATLRDVSQKRNTYVRAETYWPELQKLRPGEIYVSDVIGAYVGSRIIGIYTPGAAAKIGMDYAPEKSAFAGRENPLGKRFQGIVRWAAPVVRDGGIIGYVTLALDHDHLMEFTDHLSPTPTRYGRIADAYEGNYAFIWDHKGRSICHPRHFSIAGYDPETGDPQVAWLEAPIYEAWKASGKSYAEFIPTAPTFLEQSNSKKPAAELTKQGLVGLDCRYLNFAPQCTGWFDLTREGGSGSFLINWSGLWKLTTAAAIPYYTGQYGASLRGFGFVAIGAGVDDFHKPAMATKKTLDGLFEESEKSLGAMRDDAYNFIARNLRETNWRLSVSTGLMVALVVFIAVWIASAFTRSITRMIDGITRFRSGERHFRFNAPVKDEMGTLADSFDDMADSLVKSVADPLTIIDMQRNVLYMNEAGLRLINAKLPDIIGMPYAANSLYPVGTPYCPVTAMQDGFEAKLVFHEATGRYYKGVASALLNKNGEQTGFIIITTDFTTIIAAQQDRERQRQLLNTIFNDSPDLMWLKDRMGRYLAVNPRFERFSGRKQNDCVGLTANEIFFQETAEKFMAMETDVTEKLQVTHGEEVLVFADDGHTEVVDVVRTPVFDVHGNYHGLLGVGRDVTSRVQIEHELRYTQMALEKTAEQANRASEYKSAFLALMSHEIRTPMGAIIGMANIIQRKLRDPQGNSESIVSHINQIEISSQHLLALLNDILDISKIEAGKIKLSEELLNLHGLIDNVISIITPRCTEKGILFKTGIGGIEPAMHIGDALRLRQTLINFLSNAVKFTPSQGEVRLDVEQLERKNGQSHIKFVVSDTGIGIPAEAFDKLFEPFEQANQDITRKYGGTGLGMSIARNIVELMGGEIKVQSKVGKGSVFSFTIWLKEAQIDDAVVVQQASAVTLNGKRALLVDDVILNRMIVIELLSDTGLEIDEAEDGRQGIDAFTSSEPGYYDIILMDIQMPGIDGYEAARAIRALPRSDARTVPIVAMTANAFREDIEKALDSGMNAHLAKPLELDKFNEILARYLC